MFAVRYWYKKDNSLTIYTIQNESSATSLFDDFLDRYENHEKYASALQQLIDYIFSKFILHAQPRRLVRHEGAIDALPGNGIQWIEAPDFDKSFPLRLYCSEVGPGIWIFYGGGIKTAATAQDGDTSTAYYEALEFQTKIQEHRRDGTFYADAKSRRLLTPYSEHREEDDLINL
jgi:hypothetical protein